MFIRTSQTLRPFFSHFVPTLVTTPRRYIFDALKSCDFAALKKKLEEHPEEVNKLESDQTGPLHYLAGASTHFGLRVPVEAFPPKKFVQLLIDKGADVNAKTSSGKTPVHFAASTGNYLMLETLLNQKQINTGIGDLRTGATPLHSAVLTTVCFDPYFRSESLLLKHSPELINKVDGYQNTPLFAIIASIPGIVEAAAKSGNQLYHDLDRIKHYYVDNIPRKIAFLLENRATVERKDQPSALDLCLQKLDPAPVYFRYQDSAFRPVLLSLCRKTQNLKKNDKNGWSLLHWAAYTQCVDVAEELLKRGLNPDEKDLKGLSPRDIARLQINRPLLALMGEKLDEETVTPHSIAEMAALLPNRGRGSYYHHIHRFPFNERLISNIFTTGLYKIGTRSGDLETKIYDLYTPGGKPLLTPMGRALHEKNLTKVKKLVDGGWNILIDNDFLFYEAVYKQSRESSAPMFSAYGALHETFQQDRDFYREVVSYLASKTWTGVTLASEFRSSLRWGHVNDEKAILILKMGLTNEMYEQDCRRNLIVDLVESYNYHWRDERGWWQSEEYPKMRNILDYIKGDS